VTVKVEPRAADAGVTVAVVVVARSSLLHRARSLTAY
jgi:hypothetical protein